MSEPHGGPTAILTAADTGGKPSPSKLADWMEWHRDEVRTQARGGTGATSLGAALVTAAGGTTDTLANHLAGQSSVAAAVADAEAAQTAAETARDAAAVNADVYADTAAGLAATSVGEQFQVIASGGYEVIRYRHDSGPTATELVRYPSALGARAVAVLSGVAGDGEAYTATAGRNVGVGDLVWFTPNATNTSNTPTLSVNGGTAATIGEADGGTFVGMLPADVPQLLLRESNGGWRKVSGYGLEVIRLTSTAGTGDAYTATAATIIPVISRSLVMFEPHVTCGDAPTLSINGGAAIPLQTENIRPIAAGQLRGGGFYLGRFSGSSIQIFGLRDDVSDAVSLMDDEGRSRELYGVTNALAEGGREGEPVVVTGGSHLGWVAGAGDTDRTIQVYGGRMVDLRFLPIGAASPVTIYVPAGATAKLYDGSKIRTVTGEGLVRVFRPLIDVWSYVADVGSVTLGADQDDAAPARDRSFTMSGQSLAKRLLSSTGMHGFQRGAFDRGWQQSWWPVDSATGGSGITQIGSSAQYWWDTVGDVAGNALTTWLNAYDAIPAGQPAPSFDVHIIGQSDAIRAGEAGFSLALYASSYRKVLAAMRTKAGATFPILISPLGAVEDDVTSDKNCSAIRYAQITLIAESAHNHLGAPYFDLPRGVDDLHLTKGGSMLLGYRTAAVVENVVASGTNTVGPHVTKVEELNSGKTIRVTIEDDPNGIGFTRPEQPDGWAILPANPDPLTADPIGVTRTFWEFVSGEWTLNFELEAATPGAVVMWPYGSLGNLRPGRIIRERTHEPLFKGYGNAWPLRPFVGRASGSTFDVPTIAEPV